MNPLLLLSSLLCSIYIIRHAITITHTPKHPIITPITIIGAMTSIANHGTNIAAFQTADRVWITLSAIIYLYYCTPHTQPIYWVSVASFVASKTLAPTTTIQTALHATTHFYTTYLYIQTQTQTQLHHTHEKSTHNI